MTFINAGDARWEERLKTRSVSSRSIQGGARADSVARRAEQHGAVRTRGRSEASFRGRAPGLAEDGVSRKVSSALGVVNLKQMQITDGDNSRRRKQLAQSPVGERMRRSANCSGQFIAIEL